MKFVISLAIVLSQALVGLAQGRQPCADLDAMVRSTYNFTPSRVDDAERQAKAEAMDKVWEAVRANQAELLPCLRAELQHKDANAFFRFDGSNLLVSLDPSHDSKQLQVTAYSGAELDDVNPETWVGVLAVRATEGFDISIAAAHWLMYPNASYLSPQHGGLEVTRADGALFLFGSMSEEQATPLLASIARDVANPNRNLAVGLLLRQATPEALTVLRSVDRKGLPPETAHGIDLLLASTPPVVPREGKPLTSRDEFVSAFNSLLAGDFDPFMELIAKVPDGERDVVAVLGAQDLELVRRVRRRIIASANPHVIEFYDSFTGILWTMVLKSTGAAPSVIKTVPN